MKFLALIHRHTEQENEPPAEQPVQRKHEP